MTSQIIEKVSNDYYSDEPPLEHDKHRRQIDALIRLLESYWYDRDDFYASGNLTIFFNPDQKKSHDFRGPDFFVVKGAQRRDRRSWVVWQEGGKFPDLIIELLSPSTATIDKTEKKWLYQDVFRTPEYFWFDPETMELCGFRLVDGKYSPIPTSPEGWLWSAELELFLGVYENSLRFFDPDKNLVLFPEDRERQEKARMDRERRQALYQKQIAEQERRQALYQKQIAEQERRQALYQKQIAEQNAQKLADYLKSLGIDPNQVLEEDK